MTSLDSLDMLDRLNCPVCRAGQELNLVCRRCGANLDLYVSCLRSRFLAERSRQTALACGDNATVQRMDEYLIWLVGSG